ncbi:MAG: hypothetical protein ACRCX2_01860 [Paraclostridium sp.]
MQKQIQKKLKTSGKRALRTLKFAHITTCLFDADLRSLSLTALIADIEFATFSIKQDGIINGCLCRKTGKISINVDCKHYESTLIHELVHYRQWKIAKHKGHIDDNGAVILNKGVRRTAEFKAAKLRAQQEVDSNPQWTDQHKAYRLEDCEIEARMIASKFYK